MTGLCCTQAQPLRAWSQACDHPIAVQVPVDRQISYPVASNLYTDSEELLRNLHLAPYSKPVVSLIDDFPLQQRHKGWQFGYATSNSSYDKVGIAADLQAMLCNSRAGRSGQSLARKLQKDCSVLRARP